MRQALETVVSGRDLDTSTARAVMDTMMEGEALPSQVGALVAALRALLADWNHSVATRRV